MSYRDEDEKQEKERKRTQRKIAMIKLEVDRLVRKNVEKEVKNDEKEAMRLVKTYAKVLRRKLCDVVEFLAHPTMRIKEEVIEAAVKKLEARKNLTGVQRQKLDEIKKFIQKRIEAKKAALEFEDSEFESEDL